MENSQIISTIFNKEGESVVEVFSCLSVGRRAHLGTVQNILHTRVEMQCFTSFILCQSNTELGERESLEFILN